MFFFVFFFFVLPLYANKLSMFRQGIKYTYDHIKEGHIKTKISHNINLVLKLFSDLVLCQQVRHYKTLINLP